MMAINGESFRASACCLQDSFEPKEAWRRLTRNGMQVLGIIEVFDTFQAVGNLLFDTTRAKVYS